MQQPAGPTVVMVFILFFSPQQKQTHSGCEEDQGKEINGWIESSNKDEKKSKFPRLQECSRTVRVM